MHARVVGAIGVLLATATVAQSWRWFAPEVGCWITLEKVPASWEDALRSCQLDGNVALTVDSRAELALVRSRDAILASPLNTPLLDYMQSLIAVHNHSAAYFIGTRANRSDSQKVHYVSIEGRRLDEMPRAVVDAIDQLDLSQGDCLCMDRRGIRAVSCWDHLPYICYSNETTECGSAPMMPTTYTSTSATSTSPSTTSTSPSTTSTSPPTTTTSSTTPPPPPPPAPMMPTTSTSTSSTSTSLSTTSTSPSTTTTSSTPPPGYKYYPTTGSYYKVHQRRSTWYEANTTCASEGAHVLVINDAAEAAIVSHIMKDATGTFKYTWTGLRYNRPGGVMEWRTVNGERLSDVYHVWFNGYSHNDEERTCAAYSTRYKRLLYETCEYRYYNMCELTVQQQQ